MRSRFRIPVLVLLAAAASAGCAPSAKKASGGTPAATVPPGDSVRILSASSMQRSYLLHVPPGFSSAEPAALVFMFHGLSEDGTYMSAVTGMSNIADANGFLVVYPNGSAPPGPLSWNAGGCCGYALTNQVDEKDFIRAILADVGRIATIDPKRIYAAGFSNGAMLSYRLACEMSETFAAVAPVAGILSSNPCQPKEPVSVIHIHGSNDVAVPIGGGGTNPSSGLSFPAVRTGIYVWVRLDKCVDSPQREQNGIVVHTYYRDCRNGTAVELYVVWGMPHVWPPTTIMPASQIIWDFFAAHPKP